VLVAGETTALPAGFTHLAHFVAAAGAPDIAAIQTRVREFDPADRQFICQTSGSTGLPKSALWNHRSPLSTAHFLAVNLALTEDDRWINLSPFFHNSGMCVTLTMCLAYAGITVYLFDRFDPNEAVETIQNEGIAATFGFGAHWTAMRTSPQYVREKFGITKALVAGPPKFYRYVEEMCPPGSDILNLYAQTENGPLVSLTELGNIDSSLRAANSGRPLPGVQVKITDLDSNELLPDGRPGRLWYKSPYLFLGYLQEDGSMKLPLDDDGYFDSGDCGLMAGGYLTYIERLGGMVKSGGENVSLAKVADALVELFKDEFHNVHAVAVPDPYWGDRVVAVARPKSPGSITIAELKARCKTALAAYEIPRDLVEWDGPWPVSPEGKLGVKELVQWAVKRVDVSQR
jgi:fatty-acyl-CoA synthase